MMLDEGGMLNAGRRLRPLLLVCLAAALTLLVPATAGAKQRDKATEAKALRALDTYLSYQASEATAWGTSADAYITSITSGCPNVLAAVNLLPSSQLDPGAMTAFVEESGGDLGHAANQPDLANFERLARTLERLHWSKRSTRSTVARFLTATRNFTHLPQSDLCGDARALAADNAMTTPPGTLLWVAQFSRAKAASDRGISRFLNAITRLDTPAVLPLLIRTEQLASKVDNELQTFANAELPKLLTTLGLTAS